MIKEGFINCADKVFCCVKVNDSEFEVTYRNAPTGVTKISLLAYIVHLVSNNKRFIQEIPLPNKNSNEMPLEDINHESIKYPVNITSLKESSGVDLNLQKEMMPQIKFEMKLLHGDGRVEVIEEEKYYALFCDGWAETEDAYINDCVRSLELKDDLEGSPKPPRKKRSRDNSCTTTSISHATNALARSTKRRRDSNEFNT